MAPALAPGLDVKTAWRGVVAVLGHQLRLAVGELNTQDDRPQVVQDTTVASKIGARSDQSADAKQKAETQKKPGNCASKGLHFNRRGRTCGLGSGGATPRST